MTSEPTISINGHLLSEAEAMTVRVAVNDFFQDMCDPNALGSDVHGRNLAAAYKDRCKQVIRIMTRDSDAK